MAISLFFLFAVVAVGCATAMVLQRNPIYCVLLLIMVMLCLAGLFLMLDAQFIAAIQVVVYAGAIMVLFLFVLMLLNLSREERGGLRLQRWFGVLFLVLLFVPLLSLFVSKTQYSSQAAPADQGLTGLGNTEAVGRLLLTKYMLPVEIASILLLIAIVGAVVLTKRGSVQSSKG